MSDSQESKRKNLYRVELGKHQERVSRRLLRWKEQGFLRRLWQKDPSLWPSAPVSEITDCLGWLSLPGSMEERLSSIIEKSEDLKRENIARVVLIGMGGSSLSPEVFQNVFGPDPGCPELVVSDSTHPAAISSLQEKLDLNKTFFLVSSKSGTTLETLSLFRYFWALASKASPSPGLSFAAITDPGTPLDHMAKKRGFRFVFRAMPDVGGRYSAFTEFGLVPAALIGVDIKSLLDRGKWAAESHAMSEADDKAPGLLIGAALGELNPDFDKLSLLASPSLSKYPEWLEQLVAESTGKDGKGILPIVNEPLASLQKGRDGRIIVYHRLQEDRDPGQQDLIDSFIGKDCPVIQCLYQDRYDIGYDLFTWELAVSAAAAILGIYPFDEPDVQRSKDLAQKAMAGEEDENEVPDGLFSVDHPEKLAHSLGSFLGKKDSHDYFGLLAYLAPSPEIKSALEDIRRDLSKKTGTATTLGFGPRYLHSSGQFHKGGPNTGLFIQIIDETRTDLPVPETDFTFKRLLEAQARGDFQALKLSGRRVFRISLREEALHGLSILRELIQQF